MRRLIDAIRVYSITLRFYLMKPNRLGRISWVSVFSYQESNFKALFITLKLLFYVKRCDWLLLKI
ncbi:hypothetical protein CBW52_19165 [Yersinia kristensenii]|uniref:Uncharacterized protein n=1 Tax=Yersinia kristensenii TaxID=28152 RepID=A0AB73NKB5_YERKR|nr:hypothetical protein CBW52_19165 [Yersinia kristensenii]PHZ34271.1 hypothetical protein CS536_19265 [Yersinia kristensenii]